MTTTHPCNRWGVVGDRLAPLGTYPVFFATDAREARAGESRYTLVPAPEDYPARTLLVREAGNDAVVGYLFPDSDARAVVPPDVAATFARDSTDCPVRDLAMVQRIATMSALGAAYRKHLVGTP